MNFIRDDIMVAYADGELAAEDCQRLERLLDIDIESRSVLLSLRLAALYAKEAINGLEFAHGLKAAPHYFAERPDVHLRWPQGPTAAARDEQAQARRVKGKIKTP